MSVKERENNQITEVKLDIVPLNPVLDGLIKNLDKIDFREKVFKDYRVLKSEWRSLEASLPNTNAGDKLSLQSKIDSLKEQVQSFRLEKKHFVIVTVEEVLKVAQTNNLGLCRLHDFIYMYNGRYWEELEADTLKVFLRRAAKKLGVDEYDARHYRFSDELFKQFLAEAYLPKPKPKEGVVLINLRNGTYHITQEKGELMDFDPLDYLMYQLPFDFDEKAQAPVFQKYLNEVQPDKNCQDILSEYLGYLFLPHLKLEKALILYGTGANGKSVFFEIVSKLIGRENISNFSLSSLTNESGYYRAQFANKLLNYASEINGKLEASKFKQLVSGEPIEARLPYGQPFVLEKYGKFIFNCNELPTQVEHTYAFFRRFIIVPFEVQIPVDEQDKNLPIKITNSELSGVFNWVLEGLWRLQDKKQFTTSDLVNKQLVEYRDAADNVKQFLKDDGYIKSIDKYIKMKDLYRKYQEYCRDSGYPILNKKNMRKRLEAGKVEIKRINVGNVAYLEQSNPLNIEAIN
jgi:putative DNA primase/helicase